MGTRAFLRLNNYKQAGNRRDNSQESGGGMDEMM
jgi:hypothetical protein